jgi:hypothetical protein
VGRIPAVGTGAEGGGEVGLEGEGGGDGGVALAKDLLEAAREGHAGRAQARPHEQHHVLHRPARPHVMVCHRPRQSFTTH